MAAPSSSLPSENEMKQNPYQLIVGPGPTGAYEARQIANSFYVRVDMPGVPPDGVKLVKYSDTHTVTFSGKAPKCWGKFDSSTRVYGGYVVLDRDPNKIEVEMTVKNGCMRLVFPGADGTLHFLGGLKRAPNAEDRDDDGSVFYNDCDESHLLESSVSSTSAFCHINPYLMQGVEGVTETKEANDIEMGECLYIRVDMPGVAPNLLTVDFDTDLQEQDSVLIVGEGDKQHPFDQGGRTYTYLSTFRCGCCIVAAFKKQLIDGVFRILIRKTKIKNVVTSPNPKQVTSSNPKKVTSSKPRRRR